MRQDPHARPSRRWIQTDEAEDVAASVRHVLRCRAMVNQDPHAWKWVALGLHAALQGTLVCHLFTAASPLGVVTGKHAQEWVDYFEASRADSERRPPKARLLDLSELIKLARKPGSAGDGRSIGLVRVTDAELVWLRLFHTKVRNQFVHFEPMGWSVEVLGLSALSALIARNIDDALQVGWAFRHKNGEWHAALEAQLAVLANRP